MCVLYIYIYLIRVYNHSFSFWPSPSQFFMETYQAYMGSIPIWAGEFSEGFPFYGYPSLSSGSSATEILVPKKITDVLWKWGKYDFENGSFGIHMADMSSLVHYSGPKISVWQKSWPFNEENDFVTSASRAGCCQGSAFGSIFRSLGGATTFIVKMIITSIHWVWGDNYWIDLLWLFSMDYIIYNH